MIFITRIFLAAVLLTFFGCATTAPVPLTIKHERKNHGYIASKPDPDVAALIELLKKKNLISEEEVARFKEHAGVNGAAPNKVAQTVTEQTGGGAGTPTISVQPVLGSLESGLSAEKEHEAEKSGKVTTVADIKEKLKKDLQSQVKQKVHEELTGQIKESNKERIAKMSTSVGEKLKKDIQDQIKDRIREEISNELKEKENEQIEKITNNVSQSIRKDLVELARKQVWDELPEEIKKSRKDEVEKVTAGVAQELMKGVQEEVRKRVTQELPGGLKASEQDRMENILSNVNEELRKTVLEEVVSEVQEELPGEIKTDEKEQIEKIAANVDDQLKSSLNNEISNQVREELPKEEMKKADTAAALPDWIRRIHLGGDMRLRYEKDLYDKNNAQFLQPANPTQLMDTMNDQDLFKYRVRVGAGIDINDELESVIRLSTGNTSNPVSTNSILGTYLNKDNVLFDLAYLKWKPSEYITMYGGRIPNPWFYSDLVWSRDLNFEGLVLSVREPVKESLTPFFTAGAFPLQQYAFSTRSKWLYGGQVGLEQPDPKGLAYKIGGAYYYYSNITGIANNPLLAPGATNWTAPLYMQKGNTLFDISGGTESTLLALASEYKEVNITGTLDIGFWDPYHVMLLGDFVKNIGFNANDVAARVGQSVPDATIGYQIGMSVGHPLIEQFGQWKASLSYKYLESDAVVDAFTDPDFHLGGTNAKGWIVGADFGLAKNFWLTARWLSADQISGPPLAIDVFQLDFNAKF